MKKIVTVFWSMFIAVMVKGMERPWTPASIHEQENVLWHQLLEYEPPSEKPIVLIITVYNNKPWVDIVLDSVFAQKYRNYRLIIITDQPTDGCDQAMEEYIQKCGQEQRVTFIKNTEWKSQLANHYTAAHLCDDHEIMINLDCDDCFKHEYVFALINKIYSAFPHIYCTYGGSEYWPKNFAVATNTPIPDRVIKAGNFRQAHWDDKFSWVWWHPRTFYAWVFKQVKLQDLLHQSSFKPLAPSPDSAFMYPILEMLRGKTLEECHFMHIPDILYVWNMQNPLSQWCSSGTKQMEMNRLVASWEPYPLLTEVPAGRMEQFKDSKAAIIMFPESASHALSLLHSVYKYAKNSHELYLVYQADEPLVQHEYESLKNMFPTIKHTVLSAYNAQHGLKNLLTGLSAKHVLFLAETPLQRSIDLNWALCELERTFAHGFFMHITQDNCKDLGISEYAPVTDQLGTWQFKWATSTGKKAYDFDGVLYRKHEVDKVVSTYSFTSLDEFKKIWMSLNEYPSFVGRKVGLFLQ